jgi:hypothetical protein
MGRKAKNELAQLARAAKSQVARAEALGKSLDSRIKMKREASPEWTPNEDDRRDFAAITNTLQHAGNALIRGLDANKKDLGGLTEEQLQAQFNAEIVNSAHTLSDEDWFKMVEARRKAGRAV